MTAPLVLLHRGHVVHDTGAGATRGRVHRTAELARTVSSTVIHHAEAEGLHAECRASARLTAKTLRREQINARRPIMRGCCSEERWNHANGPGKLSKVRSGRGREGLVGGRSMPTGVGKRREEFAFVGASVRARQQLRCVWEQCCEVVTWGGATRINYWWSTSCSHARHSDNSAVLWQKPTNVPKTQTFYIGSFSGHRRFTGSFFLSFFLPTESLLKLRSCLSAICGMEWYCYATLGVLTAILSFTMDLCVTKLLNGYYLDYFYCYNNNNYYHIASSMSLPAFSSPVALQPAGGPQSTAVLLLDALPSMPLCSRCVLLRQRVSRLHRFVWQSFKRGRMHVAGRSRSSLDIQTGPRVHANKVAAEHLNSSVHQPEIVIYAAVTDGNNLFHTVKYHIGLAA